MPTSTHPPEADGDDSEIERLRRERDVLLDTTFNRWSSGVMIESRMLRDIQNTVSWRLTRPLRQVRTVQRKVGEVGASGTARLVLLRVRTRISGGRR